jgi:Fe-S cluster assembly protein SufD
MKTLEIKRSETKIIVTDKIESGKIILGAGVKVIYVLIAREQGADKALIEFNLDGAGSEVRFFGFVIGNDKKRFNFETVARHIGKRTISRCDLKSALFASSAMDYKGNIRIEKNAGQSDAHLTSRTLLLSPDAHVNTVPALEILANDVKAGHSATIGKIDEESLFYLLSRGLDKDAAKKLIIESFFESQIKMIDDESAQKIVREKLGKLIPHHV